MKINYIKIVSLASALTVGACNDFINIDSPTIVRQDLFFQSTSDFTSAVNGVYSGLRGYYSGFFEVAEIPSDNTEANGYTLGFNPMDLLTWVPSTAAIQSRWTSSYSIIARANLVLARIEGFQMDETLKRQYIGETSFIRALIYFNLVQFYGDVPLVLTEIKSESEAYAYGRAPVSEVYAQIEADLKTAIDFLPATYDAANRGRATKGAARSLLGKVYVTSKQFDKARDILKEVIDSQQYRLLDDYAEIFSVNNRHNEEIVFAVQYNGGTGYGEGSNFSIAFAPFGSGEAVTSGGMPASYNSGTLDLYEVFEENDARKPVSIDLWTDSDMYYTRKFLDRPMAPNEGKNNWIVLRYADVILLYAEALNETGNTSEALTYLNMIRDRADLLPLSNLNQNEFRSAVLQERRVELCFEGHRWFDLIRTGTMLSTMRAYKEKYTDTRAHQVVNYEVTDNKVLFPIPFREISLNPELTQNPGYN